MRKKLPDNKKRKSFSITIDEKLLDIFGEHVKDKSIKNKSRYIENLIRKDMESRGEDIKREF
jgi:metal-responsive CopG/Arc/MetJ family transcriptional regulator